MSITITCPKCRSTHKVKVSLRGKKVRCPTESCGRLLTVPDLDTATHPAERTAAPVDALPSDADATDTFRLAAPAGVDEAPALLAKRRSRSRDCEPIPTARSANQEILLPDGRIRPMTMRDIRDALIAGKITRFSLMRSIREEDGTVTNRGRGEKAWKPIGFSVFIAPEKERPHYTKAARQGMSYRDDVALISGISLFVLVMLGVGVLLYRRDWDFSGEQVAGYAAVAGGMAAFEVGKRGWVGRHTFIFMVIGAVTAYVVVRNLPEMSVAMAKTGIFVCAGLITAAVAKGLGFLGGIAFDYAYRAAHYDPSDSKPHKPPREQAPYYGYPWMFWRGWDQKRLLCKTLAARNSKRSTSND